MIDQNLKTQQVVDYLRTNVNYHDEICKYLVKQNLQQLELTLKFVSESVISRRNGSLLFHSILFIHHVYGARTRCPFSKKL